MTEETGADEPTYVTGWEGTLRLATGAKAKVGGYDLTDETLKAVRSALADLERTLNPVADKRIEKITIFLRPNRKGWRLLVDAEGLTPLESLDHNNE